MPIIIDGNNLAGNFPGISLEQPSSIPKIIRIVKKFQENRNNNVIIVFDAEPELELSEYKNSSKFSVVYPKFENTADDEIKNLLNNITYFKDVVLVTSDRELKNFARQKGAKTINSIEFYFELKRFARFSGKKEESQKRIDTALSDTEVDQWMKIFQE